LGTGDQRFTRRIVTAEVEARLERALGGAREAVLLEKREEMTLSNCRGSFIGVLVVVT
jgi:hypothetical protein